MGLENNESTNLSYHFFILILVKHQSVFLRNENTKYKKDSKQGPCSSPCPNGRSINK